MGATYDVMLDPSWQQGDDLRVFLDGDLLQDAGPGMRNPDLRDAIWLDLPELGDAVLFEEQSEGWAYPGSRTWTGAGPTQGVDELLLTVYQGAVAGYLNLGGVEYAIRGWSDGALTIIEAPPTAYDDAVDDTVEDLEPQLESAPPTAPMAMAAPSNPGGTASSQGPFAGVDAVVDLLVVYGPPAATLAGSDAQAVVEAISGVVVANRTLQNSNVSAAIRLLDVLNIGWQSATNACDARDELNDPNDGQADDVPGLRETYGADLVMGLTDGIGGCGQQPPLAGPGPSTADTDEYFTLGVDQTEFSVKHEFGHNAGLWHSKHNVTNRVVDYAYGYLWPDSDFVTDPTTICSTDEAFRTAMSKEGVVTIGSTDFDDPPRLNIYSTPSLTVSRCSGTKDIVAGTDVSNGDGVWADAARRLRETTPAVADYRPSTSLLSGAVVTTPSPGATVGGTATFTWNSVGANDSYWIEVYDPATGAVYADQPVAGTSHFVAGMPGTSTTLAVRLWTDLSGAPDAQQWVWVDHRYNNILKLVDCVDDPGAGPAPSTYQDETCDDTAGSVCSLVSGSMECTLVRTGAAGLGESFTVSQFHPDGPTYDIATWGRGDNGERHCCLLHDPGNAVSVVEVAGSANVDLISFNSVPHRLDGYGGTLAAEVNGGAGGDWIIGSTSVSADYSELLRGRDGDDLITGNAGDDELRGGGGDDNLFGGEGDDLLDGLDGIDELFGGPGDDELLGGDDADTLFGEDGDDELLGGANNDTLFGGRGHDVLIAGEGQDDLFGGPGADTLCTENAGDRLDGDEVDAFANTLYISSGASGAPHSLSDAGQWGFCGHTGWGSSWADICTYSLTTAPTACSAAGVPD